MPDSITCNHDRLVNIVKLVGRDIND